jgi:homoserine dehydrogenase
LFKAFIPILTTIRKIAKNNLIIQTIFSETALNYIGKSITYKTEKIQELGFEFKISIKEAITSGLMEMDPNKKLIKANLNRRKE